MRSQTTEKRQPSTSYGSRQKKQDLYKNQVQESFNIEDFLLSTKQQQSSNETQIVDVDQFEKYRFLVSRAKNHLNHKLLPIENDCKKNSHFFITSTKFQVPQNYQIDDQEIKFQNNEKFDDLKELRKMIKKTKRNMSNFGDSLYDLNKNVQNLNTSANLQGMGVKDYVFDAMNYSLKRKLKK